MKGAVCFSPTGLPLGWQRAVTTFLPPLPTLKDQTWVVGWSQDQTWVVGWSQDPRRLPDWVFRTDLCSDKLSFTM